MNNILGLNEKIELYKLNSVDFANSANQISTNNKLDTANNNLTTINTSIGTSNTQLTTLNSNVSTAANQLLTNNKLDTANNSLTSMNYVLSNSFSSLGRLYVQNPYEVIQMKFDTNNQLDFYDYSYTNAGVSVNNNTSTLELVSTGAQTRQFQTKNKAYYEAGKSTEIYFTARLFDATNANSETRIGLFDNNDGLFIGYNGATNDIQIVRRTSTSGSVVNNVIPRTSFNLNTLNGFDFSKFQVFHIHFLYLGYAYFHFALIHNGQIIKFHEEFFTNNSTVPYLKSPSLPFRAECITTVGTQTLRSTCASVNIESGYDLVQKSFNINNGLVLKTVTNAETVLLLIRINPTFNKASIRIKKVEIANTTTTANQTVRIAGYILFADSATITPVGGTFVSLNSSVAEYNITATGLTYAGIRKQIYSTYQITSARDENVINPLDNEINFGLTSSDYFYLTAQTSAGTCTINFNVNIEESY